MDQDLKRIEAMRRELRDEIARGRPVRDVSGVSPDVDAQLREQGIRTVAQLAEADPDKVATKIGMDRKVTRKLVAAAKHRLELGQKNKPVRKEA